MTMNLIGTTTIPSGGAVGIDFFNIPQIYSDLKLVISGRTTGTNINQEFYIAFSGNTGNIYYSKIFQGTGSVAGSSSAGPNTGFVFSITNGGGTTANTFGTYQAYIPNYSSTNNYKTISAEMIVENNSSTGYQMNFSGNWQSNSAITQISCNPAGGLSWVQNTTASLYGITKGSGLATVS